MVIAIESLLISVYYIVKCVRIYSKTKKEYLKSLNDISEIVKEEKIIKIETHRRRNKKTEEKNIIEQAENKPEKKEKKKATKEKGENKDQEENNKQTTAQTKAKTQAKSNNGAKKKSKKKKKK